jgi:hypothetical protein
VRSWQRRRCCREWASSGLGACARGGGPSRGCGGTGPVARGAGGGGRPRARSWRLRRAGGDGEVEGERVGKVGS